MKRIYLFLSATLLVSAYGCSKDEIPPPREDEGATQALVHDGDGRSHWKKIEIPNTEENIRRMWEEQFGTTRAPIPNDIRINTHHYVRFEADTDEQYYAVLNDENMDVYPYPLDCEIPAAAISYRDPEQPLDKPPFLFGTMPIGHRPPNGVRYTILKSIVMEGGNTAVDIFFRAGGGSSGINFGRDTLYTEIEPPTPEEPDTGGGSGGGGGFGGISINPCGRIRVWDDEVGDYIPLVGAKVRIRKNLISRSITTVTDATGSFTFTNAPSGSFQWSIIWEGNRYDIRDGTWGQAFFHRNSTTREDWYLDIGSEDDGSKSLRFATIHRAANRYFNGDTGGLQRPNLHPIWGRKLKICYYDRGGSPQFWGNILAGLQPNVLIYKYYVGSPNNTTRQLFGIVCHEIGHAAHSNNMSSVQYWQVEKYIYESWADFVLWHMTMLEYRALKLEQTKIDALDNDNTLSLQAWPVVINSGIDYSPIFIDLIDDFNQSLENTNGYEYPNDAVTGYTAGMLNAIVLNSYGALSLKTNLKANKPIGVTNDQIDDLFIKYEKKW